MNNMALMENFVNGILIGVEGIDGSGKTVLAQALASALTQYGCQSILTKEPGGTKFGLQLRQILQYREEVGQINAKAEYLLFAADRAQHFTEVVLPNLQLGKIVIADRTGDSSVVYQGYGRGLDIAMIKQINGWAMCGMRPDLVIYLKIDDVVAQKRVSLRAEKLTAFEQAGTEFVQRLISGFDQLYSEQEGVLTLNGTLPTGELVAAAVRSILPLVMAKGLI